MQGAKGVTGHKFDIKLLGYLSREVSVIKLDCRILGEARFYALEATATFLNISGLLPKCLRCFVYFLQLVLCLGSLFFSSAIFLQ